MIDDKVYEMGRNQRFNITNPAQTSVRKVLTVCSAGMLRSPTLANVIHAEYGYNVRSCGTTDYALIPITEALVAWADEIVFVSQEVYDFIPFMVLDDLNNYSPTVTILDIPDNYDWNSLDLIEECKKQYAEKHSGEIGD